MKKNVKITGAVLCTALLASIVALSGCGENSAESQGSEVSSFSSTVSSETNSIVSSAAESTGSSEVSSSTSATVTPAGALGESQRVDPSYFDDAVFIGDSVSNKLRLYVTAQRKTDASYLGKAQFLTAGSLGSHNALWDVSRKDSVHPAYEGNKSLLEDSVAAMGAKKVYIMLGMNDIGLYGVEDSITSMETLIQRILEKSPDAKIYIESATPMMEAFETTKLNNDTIMEYNQKMLELCQKKGYYFVDVASVMKDENGNLIADYCSDPYPDQSGNMGIHFTDVGCKVWIDYLYTHTA